MQRLQQLEASASSDSAKKELLYNLERGELLRLAKRYADSTAAYTVADEQVKTWEQTAKTSPEKLLGNVGAALISERLKSYEGQDYEKVWLTTRLALNRMAVGDFENSRVDIKRTHEREAIIAEFRLLKMGKAADLIEQSVHETLSYYAFPDIHWQKIRTNNPLERIMREIRRRTRVVGAFPDGQSCLNLAAARLRHIAGTQWSTKRYMNMRPLFQAEETQTEAAVA